jgi:hypothetical protein
MAQLGQVVQRAGHFNAEPGVAQRGLRQPRMGADPPGFGIELRGHLHLRVGVRRPQRRRPLAPQKKEVEPA